MKKIIFVLLFFCIFLLISCKNLIGEKNQIIITVRINKDSELYEEKYSAIEYKELYEMIIPVLENRLKMNKAKMKYEIDNKSGDLKLIIKTSTNMKLISNMIEPMGNFEFKIVSEEGTKVLNELEAIADESYYGEGFLKFQNELNAKVPGTELVYMKDIGKWGENKKNKFLAVKKETIFGDDLKIINAKVITTDYGIPVINFEFDKENAVIWSNITEKAAMNQERIAILLDDIVLMAPYVKEKIPNGKCQLTMGNESNENLNYYAALLQYPQKIPLKIIEISEY